MLSIFYLLGSPSPAPPSSISFTIRAGNAVGRVRFPVIAVYVVGFSLKSPKILNQRTNGKIVTPASRIPTGPPGPLSARDRDGKLRDSWLMESIEAGIRKEVRLLRNCGFNTTCSCGHEMTIECHYIADGEMYRLHRLLYDEGYRNYTISMNLRVLDGHSYPSLTVKFNT